MRDEAEHGFQTHTCIHMHKPCELQTLQDIVLQCLSPTVNGCNESEEGCSGGRQVCQGQEERESQEGSGQGSVKFTGIQLGTIGSHVHSVKKLEIVETL